MGIGVVFGAKTGLERAAVMPRVRVKTARADPAYDAA
jgi:hypothetical protein